MIVISPHFDDGIGSCAGTMQRLAGKGHSTTVVTVMSQGPTPSRLSSMARATLAWHAAAPRSRRSREDRHACELLGLSRYELGFVDAPYRRAANGASVELFPAVRLTDSDPWVAKIADAIETFAGAAANQSESSQANFLAFPMAFGQHIDHQLCALAGLRLLRKSWPVVFYREFYYEDTESLVLAQLASAQQIEVKLTEPEFTRKLAAFECYASQVRPLYRNVAALRAQFQAREASEHFFVPALGGSLEDSALNLLLQCG